MKSQSVAIIGAGRVGSSVGFLLKRAGYRITGIAARTDASASAAAAFIGEGQATSDVVRAARGADIVFLTTPDGSIGPVCETIAAAGVFAPGCLVVHMSGAHSLDLLDAARRAKADRSVLHPLQSLASREQGVRTLPGSYFRIEADPAAEAAARSIVKALGGLELALPRWQPGRESAALYHAGAVAVSNYFVALVDYGLKFYEALGANRGEALQAVLPLIRGTLHNIETLGIPDALTGPIMRGDVRTVREHLDAMQHREPQLLALYKELGRRTVALARERKTLSPDAAQQLLDLLAADGR